VSEFPRLWNRRWKDVQDAENLQALYAIPLIEGAPPNVGVRISIKVDPTRHQFQSYATAELFDGNSWHTVAALPPALMKSAVGPSRAAAGVRVRWSDDGVEKDIDLLLNDCQLAFFFRAPGPQDWARIQRAVSEIREET